MVKATTATEKREQTGEAAAASGGQERLDDFPVGGGRVAVRALERRRARRRAGAP
jgi:hypothetical protein